MTKSRKKETPSDHALRRVAEIRSELAGQGISPPDMQYIPPASRMYGYCRVSTAQQDTTIQRDMLVAYFNSVGQPIENRIFEDIATGANTNRENLLRLMERAEAGDIVVIPRLDRLTRNMMDALALITTLDERGVTLRILDPAIEISGIMGKLFIVVLSLAAEMERSTILARTAAGREAAIAEGKSWGRPRQIDREKVEAMVKLGIKPTEIARELKISRSAVYDIMDPSRVEARGRKAKEKREQQRAAANAARQKSIKEIITG